MAEKLLKAGDLCQNCRSHKETIDYIHAILYRLVAKGLVEENQDLDAEKYIIDSCDSALRKIDSTFKIRCLA